MRDLYFRLGISRNASAAEVAAALDLKPEMGVYAPILLDKEKRAEYDRTHAALSAIGELRNQLGLNSGNTGFVETYPDFALSRRTASSARVGPVDAEAPNPTETPEIPQRKGKASKRATRSKWLVPVLAVLALIILLVLMRAFFWKPS
jgi:DnaJ-class molecular chaperone